MGIVGGEHPGRDTMMVYSFWKIVTFSGIKDDRGIGMFTSADVVVDL